MIKRELLIEELMVKKMRLQDLAKFLNISKVSLCRRLNGSSEFTLAELKKIRGLIGSKKTTEIFFEN